MPMEKPLIIGLLGLTGSGKSSLANGAANRLPRTFVYHFKQPVFEVATHYFLPSHHPLFMKTEPKYDRMTADAPAGHHKSFRDLMIKVGVKLREVDPDLTVDFAETCMSGLPDDYVMIFDDVRQDRELHWIHLHDGYIIKLGREGDSHGMDTLYHNVDPTLVDVLFPNHLWDLEASIDAFTSKIKEYQMER